MEKSNHQIGEIVELVRGKLSSGARLTLGALTVIDVHGKCVTAALITVKAELLSLNEANYLKEAAGMLPAAKVTSWRMS